jgi:exonuclease RecJ (EC 3.1.-.-)
MNAPTLPATHWILPEAKEEVKNLLLTGLGINPVISQILINRNILSVSDAKRFLSPSLNDLHNPFLMKDMQKGIDRLIKAIYGHEKVLLYGDYDTDGITSVALLVKFLREIHDDVAYYIP